MFTYYETLRGGRGVWNFVTIRTKENFSLWKNCEGGLKFRFFALRNKWTTPMINPFCTNWFGPEPLIQFFVRKFPLYLYLFIAYDIVQHNLHLVSRVYFNYFIYMLFYMKMDIHVSNSSGTIPLVSELRGRS